MDRLTKMRKVAALKFGHAMVFVLFVKRRSDSEIELHRERTCTVYSGWEKQTGLRIPADKHSPLFTFLEEQPANDVPLCMPGSST